MNLGLTAPLLILAFAAVGLAVVASLSGKRKRLEERVLTNAPRGLAVPLATIGSGADVRVRPPETESWRFLHWVLNIPEDLPLAHVVAPIWIVIGVTVLAALTGWLSHFIASWWFCLLDAIFLWYVLTRSIFGWELSRYRTRLLKQLPDTINLVISATRAGLPVSESFRTVMQEMPNPTGAEFERVVDEMSLGIAADDALLSLHRRTGVTEYAIFAVTIGVQARSGGRLAETITNLADTVRDRIAIAGKARALSAEARTSAIFMAVLPVICGGVLQLTRPGYLSPLFNTPGGHSMLIFGIVTLVLGIITMRQLINSATRD